MSELVRASEFLDLIRRGRPILDVRAPVEFDQGHFPGSVNHAILTDTERERVGTVYKEQGPEAAVLLGHELVRGETKERRIRAWCEFLARSEDSLITCFRGGMRSGLAQEWCAGAGVRRPRVQGGYKALRHELLENFTLGSSGMRLTVLSGATGAGKTRVLRALDRRVLDLEKWAEHRGSAFGGRIERQPAQAVFENRLMAGALAAEAARPSAEDPLVVEDESRMIGLNVQPEVFFVRLRSSPVVLIDEPVEKRAEITFDEYIRETPIGRLEIAAGLELFDFYRSSLDKIKRRLGGLRHAEVVQDLEEARRSFESSGDLEPNRTWIRKLLEWYYDPLYFSSLERRDPAILFRGDTGEVIEFLQSRSDQAAQPFPFRI